MQNKIIEKLRKQVARAESKGNFNSAHHRVLASYEANPAEGVSPQKRRTRRKEIVKDGK